MRFNQAISSSIQSQLEQAASELKSWQNQNLIDDTELKRLRKDLQCFNHTPARVGLSMGGVDGSGDFPLLSFADTFIYLSIAQASLYQFDVEVKLRESLSLDAKVGIAVLLEDSSKGPELFDRALAHLLNPNENAQELLLDVIIRSDYLDLKKSFTKKRITPNQLYENLIRPHASDVGNIAIQLRSTAEFAAAYQLIKSKHKPNYLLMDTTYALPLVSSSSSLFYEHLKRLCAVEARKQDLGFFTLSKSHGLSAMEQLELIAAEKQGLTSKQTADHWYLRLPSQKEDGYSYSFTREKTVPPIGAMSYLVRFYRTTPIMRLDMDINYWRERVKGGNQEETLRNEQKLFEDLDVFCHDVRSYGYPFPIKAAHDRASLTVAERQDYKKQATKTFIKQGMNPNLFRDVSLATGHK